MSEEMNVQQETMTEQAQEPTTGPVKEPIKTLANCTLPEFLRQTNRIRHVVADFYKECNIGEIYRRKPELNDDDAPEDKKEKIRVQARQNLSDILDVCLETNAEKTVEVIGLMAFKDADEANQMTSGEFFDIVFSLLGSERVIDFFTKTASSGLLDMVMR